MIVRTWAYILFLALVVLLALVAAPSVFAMHHAMSSGSVSDAAMSGSSMSHGLMSGSSMSSVAAMDAPDSVDNMHSQTMDMDCDSGHCPVCFSENSSSLPQHDCGTCFEVEVPGSSALVLNPHVHSMDGKHIHRACCKWIESDNDNFSDPPDKRMWVPVLGERTRVLKL